MYGLVLRSGFGQKQSRKLIFFLFEIAIINPKKKRRFVEVDGVFEKGTKACRVNTNMVWDREAKGKNVYS